MPATVIVPHKKNTQKKTAKEFRDFAGFLQFHHRKARKTPQHELLFLLLFSPSSHGWFLVLIIL